MLLKNFKNVREVLLTFVQASLIAAMTIFAVVPVSCKVSTEGIQIVGGDYTSPCMEELKVIDENSVQISFSKKVRVTNAVLSPFIEGLSDSGEHSADSQLSRAIRAAGGAFGKIPVTVESAEGESNLLFKFENPTAVGKAYELYGIVEDESGNSLTFTVGFTGFNPKLPSLLMTEVQIKYKKKETVKAGVEYLCEFVEVLVLEDGNLAGLRIVSASDGEKKAYEMPGIEVHKGEVLLFHLRTAGDGCISELEDDLNLSSGTYSAAGVRDLWSSNTVARFNDTSDVIFIEDKSTGTIIDGLMYAGEGCESWKDNVAVYAKRLYEQGIWYTEDISGAVLNNGTSHTKSFHRLCGAEILKKLEAGEEIELPLCSDEDSWKIGDVSHGTL